MTDLIGPARKLRITSESIGMLLNGKADIEVARSIGVNTDTLQKFLDGNSEINMARSIGITTSDLRNILKTFGKEGSKAFVLGLAFGRKA